MKYLSPFLLLIMIGCDPKEPVQITGETMATTYNVTYFDPQNRNFKTSIDSILIIVNKSINNYDSASEISLFNKSRRGIKFKLPYLLDPLRLAKQANVSSGGAFDPTVMPLVNAWGFGKNKLQMADTSKIDSLRDLVGFNKIVFTTDSLIKSDPRTQLDFGGIGQGYGADVIANFLKSKGVEHMLVELGGEGLALGTNLKSGNLWYLGIIDPENLDGMKAYVSLGNRAFSTSGNYYNYREVNGQRYSHIIDPQTGYPTKSHIMSASVFADNCTTADAWAKALIVSGVERSIELLKEHPELDAFLVYTNNDSTSTYATERISRHLEISK